jgi:putative transposase
LTKPFQIDAWVVLPEHIHCIWTLPEGDTDYSGRWRAIKIHFTKALRNGESLAGGGCEIWQKRFWEHTIRDERDYRMHMDYVHFNPVRHHLVPHPADWQYSTFHKCVARGFYDASWSLRDDPDEFPDMGERR